jgi:two-component system OmpR family sensor kinase/two-component system sensor histidine kinase QseC
MSPPARPTGSLRLRLVLLLLALLAVAAALLGAMTYRTVLAETEALFDYQLRQMALSLRDQGEIEADQARALRDEELDFVVQIWTVDGRSVYASRRHVDLPARALLGLADVRVGDVTWRTYSVATDERVIQVAQPRQIRRAFAADAALRSTLPIAAIAPLAALAIWWLAAYALRPLATVAEGVRQRDVRSLEPLPDAGLPEEVQPLVQALNALLARLGQSFDAQRAFVADAAHELRSPLTALTLQMALLERATDEAARREATAALAEGIARSTRLVEQLLALARHEPGAPPGVPTRLDLAELVREVLAASLPLAVAHGSELQLAAAGPVWMQGHAPALRLLVRNLVDNALRHTPPGTPVVLEVDAVDGAVRLRVDDAGPGIPPAERERVFDRFYRRTESSAVDGSGLGLAIVRSIAQQHGAQVELGDSPLGGLRVTVRFDEPGTNRGAPPARDEAQ